MNEYPIMYQTCTTLYVYAVLLAPDSRLSGTALASCFLMARSSFIHSIHSFSFLLHVLRVLKDAIGVAPSAIGGAIPGFLGSLEGVNGVILSYLVSLLDPLRSLFLVCIVGNWWNHSFIILIFIVY